jgi:hypothetical protein
MASATTEWNGVERGGTGWRRGRTSGLRRTLAALWPQ